MVVNNTEKSVLNCGYTSFNNSVCTFFKPKNDAVARRWKDINPIMFSDNLPSYICSIHFRESDIPLNNLGARRLGSAFSDTVHLKTRYSTRCTICPRSSDPFYIVSYYMKWVTSVRTKLIKGAI